MCNVFIRHTTFFPLKVISPFIPIYFLTYFRYNTAELKYLEYYQTACKIA